MLLRIKVKPNSRVDEMMRENDGTLKVKIKAPPVEGKANKYLVEFLSKALQLPKSKIILQKGETSSFKTLLIDADEAVVMQKILQVTVTTA